MSFFKPRNTNASSAESSGSANSPFIGVQAKLNIGKSNDKYEKEADSVADKVVNKEGLFGNQPFIAPTPNIQKMDEGEQEVQKSEETEQIQEKPIMDSITPLVQLQEEELQQKCDECGEEVQKKSEEEPVQMMEEEEAVQAKEEEEPIQKMEEEEAVQTKPEEEPVQMMEEEEAVQAKEEEEPIQKMEEEEAVQAKQEETEIQQRLDASTEAKDPEIQQKSAEISSLAETPNVQRKDDEIQEKEEEIQEKEGEEEIQKSSAADTGDTSNLESNLSSSKGGGSPMDSSTKDQMESGFGTDFSGVRIHNDSNAAQMNQELGSQAFANGNDIYFNEGKYDPGSKDGQHLLAHELTHTVQQGASTQPAVQTSIQKAAAAPEPADAPATKPTTPLDISHKLNLTDAWSNYLDAQYESGKRKFEVDVKIGTRYSGIIELSKKSGTAKGELAKYEITRGTKKNFLNISGWSFLNPLRENGIDPVLVLNKFGDDQVTTGFLSVAVKGIAVGNAKGFIDSLNKNLEKMGFLGIEPIKITDGFENKFEQGRLIFQVGAMATVVDGFLEAGGGMGITGDSFTFNVNAKVDVAGLASGELMLARGESGKLSGKLDIEAEIANVNAKLMVEYIEGAVTIQGSGKIQSEKFSGEITLLVTDKAKSKQMMNAALGVESMDAEKKQAEAPAAKPILKSKNNQVLAGWGEVTANITPWLAGTAKVGIDSEGHVTIVGEITVPDDVELMEQRGKKVDLFKVEIRAGYGIPLVGQVFLFASIGMFMNAGFGPLLLKNVGFKGTYSTDPDILQEFEITGTLNINAFAIIGLEAEAGVGVTILGHDLKAGVNVTAAAGLRAYAEATPTLEYKEQASPAGGKVGETRLKGHFEAAAQLFMQLSGSLFYELDSPWWSPAPDGREDFPLGEVQYPIGDSMGIGADMDWLVGSPDIPELKFSPVEFDPDKFTADVMADPPPGKKGKSDENKAGKWEDKNKPSEGKDTPETKDGKGLKGSDKKKEDLKKLPDQQKYMRSLDEMSKLEKASPKPTLEVVKAKAKKVKSKYGIDSITVKDKKEKAEISVKHKKENNKKNILKVPLMSAAERAKLLAAAMKDLRAREKKALGSEKSLDEETAKTFLAAWKKANPVVEEARVVDGTKTWDYFIDIGDKSETEKGKPKKGEDVSNEALGKEVKFSTKKEKEHRLWIVVKNGKAQLLLASGKGDEPSKNTNGLEEGSEEKQQLNTLTGQIEKTVTEKSKKVEDGSLSGKELSTADKSVEGLQDKVVAVVKQVENAEDADSDGPEVKPDNILKYLTNGTVVLSGEEGAKAFTSTFLKEFNFSKSAPGNGYKLKKEDKEYKQAYKKPDKTLTISRMEAKSGLVQLYVDEKTGKLSSKKGSKSAPKKELFKRPDNILAYLKNKKKVWDKEKNEISSSFLAEFDFQKSSPKNGYKLDESETEFHKAYNSPDVANRIIAPVHTGVGLKSLYINDEGIVVERPGGKTENPAVYSTDLSISYGEGDSKKTINIKEIAKSDSELLARIRANFQKQSPTGNASPDDREVQLKELGGNMATGRFLVTYKELQNPGETPPKHKNVLKKFPLLKPTQDGLIQVFISSNDRLKNENDKLEEKATTKSGRTHFEITGSDGDKKTLTKEQKSSGNATQLTIGGSVKIKLAVVTANIESIATEIMDIIKPIPGGHKDLNSQIHQHSEPAIYLALKMEDSTIAGYLENENVTEIFDAKLHVHTERDMCNQCAIKGSGVMIKLQEFAPQTFSVLKKKQKDFEILQIVVTSDFYFNKTDSSHATEGDRMSAEEEKKFRSWRDDARNKKKLMKNADLSQPEVKEVSDAVDTKESELTAIVDRTIIHEEKKKEGDNKYRTEKAEDFDEDKMKTHIDEMNSGGKTYLEE